jgi:hypothetical protein
MRKRIGGWLLALGFLAASSAAGGQEPVNNSMPNNLHSGSAGGQEPVNNSQNLLHYPQGESSPGYQMRWQLPGEASPRLNLLLPDAASEAANLDPGPVLDLPAVVRAQDADNNQSYEVPPPPFPYTGPFGHQRYETGGLYIFAEALYFKQTRSLGSQLVAVRGFMDIDGSVTGVPRTFVGSGQEALNTNMVSGAGNWQPGSNVGLGWRFENGWNIDVNWIHLAEARYSASASTIGPGFFVGNLPNGLALANTFLFSPVVNFPPEFAGAPQNLAIGNLGATYGIWNAAETMQEQFVQRFDMGGINMRAPIWQTDCYRLYGRFGPRLVTIWENYTWRTISADPVGQTTGADVANYHNTVSNRMYGGYFGCGNDWYYGTTPIGGFAGTIDLNAGLYMDLVKGRAGYTLDTRSFEAHRSRNLNALVPGLDAKLALWWYPWEAVSLNIGYNAFAFFNTIASRYPIDFNMGTIDPQYNTGIFRYIGGFSAGISFVF